MPVNKTTVALRQFNEAVNMWIGYLDHYTLEMLCKKPGEGSWSLGQVYTHLIGDTNYFICEIKACLQSNDNSEKEMHEDAKNWLFENEFPNVPLKNPFADSVLQPVTKEELEQGLEQIKFEVNNLCNSYDFETAKGKTLHPGLHFFSALDWLQFAGMHLRHHLRQKKKIDESLFME